MREHEGAVSQSSTAPAVDSPSPGRSTLVSPPGQSSPAPTAEPGRSSLSAGLPRGMPRDDDGDGPDGSDEVLQELLGDANNGERLDDPDALPDAGPIVPPAVASAGEPDDDAPGGGKDPEADGQQQGTDGGGDHEDPAKTAEAGFKDTPSELPHRAELEKSFGTSLDGVRVFTGGNARRASKALGADAYAVGNQIAFSTPNPSKELVAHELAHVVQHGNTPPTKSAEGGVETAGEAEAESVEQAVAAGRPASSAMSAGTKAPLGQGAVQQKRAPNLKANPKFGASMTASWPGLSRSTFTKGQSYDLWSKEILVPIAAVPGLSLRVDPSVSVEAAAGVGKGRTVRANFGVEGGIGVGFMYGVSKLVNVYTSLNAGVHGGFTYEKSSKPKNWKFWGGFAFDTNFDVGVRVGGVLDTKIRLGHLDIGRLTGLEWENNQFHRDKIGWAWDKKLTSFFNKIKNAINNAKKILELPGKAAKKAWGKLKKAPDAIYGAAQTFKKFLDKIPDITPWDGLLPG